MAGLKKWSTADAHCGKVIVSKKKKKSKQDLTQDLEDPSPKVYVKDLPGPD